MPKIPEGWIETIATNFCSNVVDGTHDSPKESKEGFLLVTGKNIKNGLLDFNGCYKISEIDYQNINLRSKVDKYDVLIGMIGTVGESCIVKNNPDFAIKNVGCFKCGDIIKSKWMYYYLNSKEAKNYLLGRLSGTTQKYITLGDLRNFPILHPSEKEQENIVNILSSFDDKIELLRAENETLEEMGQTLFKEWFGKYKVGDELPDDWKVGKLGDIVNHIKINVIPSNEPEKIFSHYSLPAFDEGEKPSKEKGELIMSNKYKVIDNCILISKLNPFFPRIRTIFEPESNAICSTEFQVLEPKKDIYFSYCHCLLNSQKFTDDISKKVQGTSSSHQRVKPDDILNSEIIIGNEGSVNDFHTKIYPMLEKIENNKKQIESLSKTRDQLLPKLMSGEVRV